MDFILVTETFFMDKAGKAAGTVTAHLYFRAITIKDSIVEIVLSIFWLFHQQELIKAHTKVTIAQTCSKLWGELDVLTDRAS